MPPKTMTEVRGRPPGAQNAQRRLLSKTFFRALLRDFQSHGEAAIIACRESDPAAYVKTVASLMPKNLEVHTSASDEVKQLTDKQLSELLNATLAKLAIKSSVAEAIEGVVVSEQQGQRISKGYCSS